MSGSTVRQVLRKTLTACIGVVVLVLLAEVVLSFVAPIVFRPRMTKLDDFVGWYHTPGYSTTEEVEGHRFTISYNSHGYRSPDHAYDKPVGRQRVVVLGDSYTDGSEVADDEVFTWKLEQALPNTEVINLGVYGYQTAQELLTLQREGLRYSPDAVVLMSVPGHDFVANVVGVHGIGPAPRFVLDRDSIAFEGLDHPSAQEAYDSWNLPAPRWVYRNSTVHYLLNNQIYRRLKPNGMIQLGQRRLASMPPEAQRELYRRIVLRMRDVCDAKGIPLVVVLVSLRSEVDKLSSSPFADLVTSLRESRITVVDLFDQLQQQWKTGPSPFYPNDPHWNVVGHEKVAQWLVEPVRTSLMPTSRSSN